MKRCKCNSVDSSCPNSCPHKDDHKHDSDCKQGKCSAKNLTVICVVPAGNGE